MKKFLDWFNKYFKWIAMAVIVVLVLFSFQQCSKNDDLSRKNELLTQTNSILSNNLKVANDTMDYWKDKYGNSLSEISILTATKDMMKKEYSDLSAKYKEMVGKNASSQQMIAYLRTQIEVKDRIIEDLKSKGGGGGSYILNDSTICIDVGKRYDTNNYYSVNGTVVANIKDNKIAAGKVDLTTSISIGLDLALSREKKTGIAHLTSKTPFPAKVSLGGITQIEQELNKKPSMYLGLGFVVGYGATIEKQPQLMPYVGVAAYLAPRWLTIKIHNR